MDTRAHPLLSRNSGEMLISGGSSNERSARQHQINQNTTHLPLNRWVTTEFQRESLPQDPPSYQKTESVFPSSSKVDSSEEECPILKFQKSMINLTNEIANVSKLADSQKADNPAVQLESSNETCLTLRTEQESKTDSIHRAIVQEISECSAESPVLDSVLSSFQPEVFPISEIRNDDSVNPPNQFSADLKQESIKALPVTGNTATPDEPEIEYSLLKESYESDSLKLKNSDGEFPVVSENRLDSILHGVPLTFSTLPRELSPPGSECFFLSNRPSVSEIEHPELTYHLSAKDLEDIETAETPQQQSPSLDEFEELGFEVVSEHVYDSQFSDDTI